MQLCNSPVGYVHSLETFGSVDGPGVRFVVFLQGCALRCKYCHNPETWADGGEEWTVEQLFQRVWRYRNYWGRKGGITVSGGEPLRQMEFLTAFFELARSKGVHTALDTAGQPFRPDDAAYLADFDRLMRSTSSPPSGVFISRCIIPTSWLVSPFTAASAAPWIPPPCRSSSISRWASPDLARRLRASLFLTRSAGRLSCPFLPLLS